MFTQKTSLIIPTKDRPNKIIKLLKKLSIYKIKFNEILVIDSSRSFYSKKVKSYCKKKKYKYFYSKASTSLQRNIGLKKSKSNKFIMFMDDDVVFFKDTFKNMNNFIKKNKNDISIAAFGFNQIENIKENFFEKIKKMKFMELLNIYPSTPGKVSESGWHSKIINLKEDVIAEWVFTTICIYKKKDIAGFKFDETFSEYSYLEDLDFSLNLKKKNKKIFISSKAKFKHPENIDRSSFNFGKIEVLNRFKIIIKHKLSKKLFLIGLMLRFLISLFKSFTLKIKYFLRAIGNIFGFLIILNKL